MSTRTYGVGRATLAHPYLPKHTRFCMVEMTLEQAFGLAVRHHTAGRLAEAEALYRKILAVQPAHADSLHLLGVLHRRSGNNQAAIHLIRQAISINPACADAHYNLGNALRDQGQHDEAIAAYHQSISLGHNLPQSYHNLGCILRDRGQNEAAAAAFRHEDEAIAAARRAIVKKPKPALDAHHRGNALSEKKKFAEAIEAYRRAISTDPDFAEAHCNLGNALLEENQPDAAIAAYHRAIQLDPNLPEAHHNLAKAFYDTGELDEAIRANRRAIDVRPGYTSAIRNLAGNLFEAGRLDESIAIYRQAISREDAGHAKLHSDLIYTLHFHPDYSDARSIAEETDLWNHRHAEPLAGSIEPHTNDRDNPRLRIGYVSPDFRNHVVGKNLVPLFANHDHDAFEIFCYSDVARPDSLTRWFQQRTDCWRETADLSDEQLAGQVREDRIDILVDLALHTQGNRLLSFARKPAPVQASFAGYPGSTGVRTIDYRLTDPYLDPPDANESNNQRILRLPNSFWCYEPGDCRDLLPGPLPAREAGFVTFGCLNNFCKINTELLNLWARAMRQIEGSRLLLLAKQGSHRQRTVDYLRAQGIDPRRVEFLSFSPRREYLKQYHRIDIGLDSFPYNGHTTSLDSFWMGVPVVTLVGQTPVSRGGWSQLSNLGLPELAGHNPEQFVQTAVQLASDLLNLEQMRFTLRARMERSSLMNSVAFSRGIEDAYRNMWKQRCERRG